MLTTWLKTINTREEVTERGRVENTELSSHRHVKITTTYKATIYENDLKASRKDWPQLKISRRNHKMDRKGEDAIQSGYTGMQGMHKWESHHNCGGLLQGARGPNPTLGFLGKGFCNGKTGPQNVWLWKNSRAGAWESQTAVETETVQEREEQVWETLRKKNP